MLDFFFYGTLLDEAVRISVVGRALPDMSAESAVMGGHRRIGVRGATYPAIQRDPHSEVPGLIFRGFTPDEAARLSHFEGEGYAARMLPVTLREAGEWDRAWVFVPLDGVPLVPTPWDFGVWSRRHRRQYLAGVRGYVRSIVPRELAPMERDWRRRASAR